MLREAHVELDVLVASAADRGSATQAGSSRRPATSYAPKERAVAPSSRAAASARRGSGPVVDAYGAGDAFAAGLTYGVAGGMPIEKALELASRCGAGVLAGRGPFEGQIAL